MSDEAAKTGTLAGVDPSLQFTRKPKEVNKEIGKDEFLQLLVTQLKHQDPMEPMKNEEFAVNLAQFSQLEQLVAINKKIGGESAGGLSSLASYLGTEVTLSSDKLEVKSGDAGAVKFNLPADTSATVLELLDADGNVLAGVDLGEMTKGEHKLKLDDVSVPDGEYGFRVVGRSSAGGNFTEEASAIGIVNGFIPGPEPLLLVDGREVTPAEISEVRLPAAG